MEAHYITKQELQPGLLRGTVRIVSAVDNKVFVEAVDQSTCGSCAASSGCGTKLIVSAFGRKSAPLQMMNDFGGVVGDRLEVGISQATLLKLSALMYLVPLVGLIVGTVFGTLADLGDGYLLICGLSGALIGIGYSRSVYRSRRFGEAIAPVYLRKLADRIEN